LLAEAVDFLVFACLLALVTNVLGQVLGVALRDPDAAAVKPVVTNIAANVKPKENNDLATFRSGTDSVLFSPSNRLT